MLQKIKVNLIPSGLPVACYASQYDEGRVIRCELYNGVQPYTLQENDVVTLNLRKPDNHVITATLSATAGNNYVDLVTTEQMTAVFGVNKCLLKITNTGVEVGTAVFAMFVQKDVLADGDPSKSVIATLQNIVDIGFNQSVGGVLSSNKISDTATASFTSPKLPLKSISVDVSATQEAGTPTPTAPKTITPITEVQINNSANNNNIVESYSVKLLAPYYGGLLTVNKGKSTFLVNKKKINLSSLSWSYANGVFTASLTDGQLINVNNVIDYMCDVYEVKGSQSSTAYSDNNFVVWHGKSATKNWVFVRDNRYSNAQDFNNNVTGELVYVTTDISTEQLGDVNIETVEGANNFSSPNGNISVEYYITVDETIEQSAGNVLFGKKWAVCGDSFTNGVLNTVIGEGKYYDKKVVYPYLIGNRNNMEIVKFFEGGQTLGYPASPDSFTNSLTYVSGANYYQNIPEDTDYITIYLGINDKHHATGDNLIPLGTVDDTTTVTYLGAYNVVLDWLIQNRPQAHIGIIVTNGIEDNDNYRQGQIAIANKYGIPYIDLNGDANTPAMLRTSNPNIASAVKQYLLDKWAVSSENTHPNDNAHIFEANTIEAFLRRL